MNYFSGPNVIFKKPSKVWYHKKGSENAVDNSSQAKEYVRLMWFKQESSIMRYEKLRKIKLTNRENFFTIFKQCWPIGSLLSTISPKSRSTLARAIPSSCNDKSSHFRSVRHWLSKFATKFAIAIQIILDHIKTKIGLCEAFKNLVIISTVMNVIWKIINEQTEKQCF